MPTETREGETTYYAGDDCPGGHAETAQAEQTPERALAAVIDARDREIAALNEQLEEAAGDRDKLDDLALERAGEIERLQGLVELVRDGELVRALAQIDCALDRRKNSNTYAARGHIASARKLLGAALEGKVGG